jgi:SSS family solute:Na+ symporter
LRIQQKEEQENETEYIRKGLVVMAFIAVLLAISIPSIVRLWYVIGSIIVPGILLPFLMTFTQTKLKADKIILTMIFPVITAIFWFIYGHFSGHYPMAIEPFYPGIILSAALIGIWKK